MNQRRELLYLECNMGIAGDMLMAALLELHPDPEDFLRRFQTLGIPKVSIEVKQAAKCGITGTQVNVTVDGEEEESREHHHAHEAHSHDHGAHNHAHGEAHSHDHDGHTHTHEHHSMADIEAMIERLGLPENVKEDSMAVYRLIAQAESEVHGTTVEEIHFHEVGMMDAVADICGCCMLFSELHPEKIIASPVNTGFGQVHCAHGIVPVPAPATAKLLKGIPVYAGSAEGELTTPTGAALLAYFAESYGNMPPMVIRKCGYGMGKKDFPAANCVRAIWGETEISGTGQDTVVEYVCSIDDMTAEELSFACERLLEEGVLEAYTTPIVMKKSRPAVELTVLADESMRERAAELIFKYTTTIGIRERACQRRLLQRTEWERETPYGYVRVKESSGYGVHREKLEYEDLKKIAMEQGMSLEEVRRSI